MAALNKAQREHAINRIEQHYRQKHTALLAEVDYYRKEAWNGTCATIRFPKSPGKEGLIDVLNKAGYILEEGRYEIEVILESVNKSYRANLDTANNLEDNLSPQLDALMEERDRAIDKLILMDAPDALAFLESLLNGGNN